MKPNISESSIDAILAHLFANNKSAAQLALQTALQSLGTIAFDHVSVAQQVRHIGASGSADLALQFWAANKQQAIILVENKIDAGFTPDQPMRYAQCREAHRAQHPERHAATLLISPAIYLQGSKLKSHFNGALSYEALRPFCSEAHQAMLDAAIERASSPYEPAPVQAVMSFFDGYQEIASTNFADLRIKANPNSANARPQASRTIYFEAQASGFRRYPFLLKDQKPASLRVSHQCWDSAAPSASVKLMIDGWAGHLRSVTPILADRVRKSGLYLRPAGRSLALVADTTRLDNMRSAFAQRASIEDALIKLRLIRETWNSMEAEIKLAAQAVSL